MAGIYPQLLEMGVLVVTVAPVKMGLTIEDIDNTANALDNCYECNRPGRVRRDCPRGGNPKHLSAFPLGFINMN